MGYFPRRQLCKTGVNETRLMGFCSPNEFYIEVSGRQRCVSLQVDGFFLPLLDHNGEPRGRLPQ